MRRLGLFETANRRVVPGLCPYKEVQSVVWTVERWQAGSRDSPPSEGLLLLVYVRRTHHTPVTRSPDLIQSTLYNFLTTNYLN